MKILSPVRSVGLYIAFRLIAVTLGPRTWRVEFGMVIWQVKIPCRSLELAFLKVCECYWLIISIFSFTMFIVWGTVIVHNVGCTYVLSFCVNIFRFLVCNLVFKFDIHTFCRSAVPLYSEVIYAISTVGCTVVFRFVVHIFGSWLCPCLHVWQSLY